MGDKTTFFTIDRRLLHEDLWTAEPFTRGQAWVDLIGRANFANTKTLKRGEIIVSERTLAERWHWSRKKVQSFLAFLEAENMVKIERIQGTSKGTTKGTSKGTRLKLENYSKYQDQGTTKGTSQGTRKGTINNKDIRTMINNNVISAHARAKEEGKTRKRASREDAAIAEFLEMDMEDKTE